MYAVDDIRCRELASEVVSGSDFGSDVSIEAGAEVFDSPGWDVSGAIACDCVRKVFGGGVDACEGVKAESRKVVLYGGGEGGPVCSIVVGVGALGRGSVGTVERVFDDEGEVVGGEFLESLPGGAEGEVGGGEGDVWGGGLCVDVVGSAGGSVSVVEYGELGELIYEGSASRVSGLGG